MGAKHGAAAGAILFVIRAARFTAVAALAAAVLTNIIAASRATAAALAAPCTTTTDAGVQVFLRDPATISRHLQDLPCKEPARKGVLAESSRAAIEDPLADLRVALDKVWEVRTIP